MINRKFMLMAIFLVSLLAISAVSASEGAVNDINASDMSNSLQELKMSDFSIESTDDDLIFEHEREDVLESTDDDINSMVDEDAWYNDKIIWYDGDWDNVKFASFDYVDGLENPENITILLSCEDNPIANVDLAFSNDYDNKLTKLTTDSDGIAVYNIPFNVKEFSFCVSFWHDEDHMTSCVDVGPYMVYSFGLDTWKNVNWDDTNETNKEEYNNSSGGSTDSGQEFNANDDGTFTALQNLVDTVPAGSTIYWENDYKVDKEFFEGYGRYFDGIIISKRLTIDGKGHTIYGGGERGTVNIFTISTDAPVTLKNMILDHGSRAIVAVSNLNIINCTFTHNTVLDSEGGAIFCEGKLTVSNSNFTENHAVYMFSNEYSFRGGAIICGGESTIFNTTFDNNEANRGSAVSGFHSGDVTLTECTFYKNYCYNNGKSNYLGPVILNGNAVNCRFIDYASSDNIVNGNVNNCTFTGDSILAVDDVTKFFGGSDKLQINLVDSLGNGIGNADVDVIIDNGNILTVKTDSNGRASVDLNLGIGEHDVVSSYEDVTVNSKVTVQSTITASDAEGTYSNSKATATFLDTSGNVLASNQVTFKIGTSSYAATTNSNGVASANIPLGVGNYTVTAVNPANNEEKQFKLTISKASSTTDLAAVQSGKSVTLTAIVAPNAATGKVTFEINGKTQDASLSNGKASVTFSDLAPNTYPATATYNGDANFMTSSGSASVKVDEVYSIVDVGDVESTYLDSRVSATFLDNNGNALANTKVTFKIGSKSYSATTNSKGVATASIDLDVGTYDVTAVNPTTNEEKQFKITISKPAAEIIPQNLNAEYASGTFTFKLVDSKTNSPLAGKKLSYTIYNTGGSVTTDDNGIATIDNSNLSIYKFENGELSMYEHMEVGKHAFRLKGDDSSIDVAELNDYLTVSQATININANSYEGYFGSTKLVTINVANTKTGAPMEGIVLHLYMLNSAAKDYYLKSDKNGIATIDVSVLLPGSYQFTVSNNDTVNIKEKKAAGTITILDASSNANPILSAKSVSYVYGNTKMYVITLTQADGTPIANELIEVSGLGRNTGVSFASGKSFYTGANGQAKLKISSLAPDTYDVKINSKGCKEIKTKITIKKATPKLTAPSKTFKLKAIKKYTVTLKSNKNTVLKNKKVTFKIMGKTFTAKTNNKGKVTIAFNLLVKKGTYSLKVQFGDKYYKTVTKNARITVK